MLGKVTNKTAIALAASLGLGLGIASGALAQMPHEGMQRSELKHTSQFQRIQQPLWLKGAVTVGGLGLIGLELWWFLGKSRLLVDLNADERG